MDAEMTLRNDKEPWYKHAWPWMLMSGPAIVIVAGVVTAWLAVRSSDGLVTDDYYKQGLAVNQQLQRDHAARDIGLQGDVMRAGLNLRLLLAADTATKLPQSLIVRLAHPTQAGQDQLVTMTSEGQGFYGGRLAADISGRWLVSIEDPAGAWRLQGEWHADSMEPLRLSAKAGK